MKLTTTRLRQIIKEELNRMSRTPSRRLKESRGMGRAFSARGDAAAMAQAKKLVNSGMLDADLQAHLEGGGGDRVPQFAIGKIVGQPTAGEAVIELRVFSVAPASEGWGYSDNSFTSSTGEDFTIGSSASALPEEVVVDVTTDGSGKMRITPAGQASFESQLGDIADFAWVPQLGLLVRAASGLGY